MGNLEQFHSKKREVTAAVAELVTLATRIGARSLATKVESDLVKKLEADRFHLVVVGEFNHGKTTFVNALLGSDLLPVGVTPTTAVIHHLEYGESPSAAVVFENDERKSIGIDEVKRYAVSGDRSAAGAEVKYVEVFVPSPILKERIVLVDTPGVNDLSLQRADITYSYIPRSDAVLFLLDAGQPLKESERVFLQEKLLAQSRDKILFVVTKRDIWDTSEEAEALAYIRGELDKILKGAPIFPVSAQRALEGERGASGMNELVTHLMGFLAEERGRILLDNALGLAADVSRLLAKGVDARKRAISMPAQDLTRRIEYLEKDLAGQAKTTDQRKAFIREEVAAIKAWVRRDLEHFQDDVIKQLPAVIDQAKTDEIKLHLGPFLERTIVDWVKKETKEIGSALELLAEKTVALVREDANETAKRLSDAFSEDVKAPKVQVDTLSLDVGVISLVGLGIGVMFTNALIGGALTALALPLGWWLKNRREKQTRERAHEIGPAVVREAAAKLGPKLEEMIETFASRLEAWVVTAGEELHRELIEILRQARTERDAGELESRAALLVAEEQANLVARAESRISALRVSIANKSAPATPAAATPTATPSHAESAATSGQSDGAPTGAAQATDNSAARSDVPSEESV
ncbi:MAG: dynamin family protein [Polyangiaceae bacterium]